MRKLFKSAVTKNADGWPMGFYGTSFTDTKNYCVDTYCLKSDEIPQVMTDSKTSTEFICGLLNAYFNKIDATKLSEEQLCNIGVVDPARTGVFDHPNQKEIEF